jgi:hypothetical protein
MGAISVSKPVRNGVLVATAAAAMFVLANEASAAADSKNPYAVCHSSKESGVETDTCVGNPNGPPDGPGYYVTVRPRLFIGIGTGF